MKMLLNELPEECLLLIFGRINDLNDLMNCYKVCSKWSYLIAERARKAKYLIGNTWTYGQKDHSLNRVYYAPEESTNKHYLPKLFVNLKIVDISPPLSNIISFDAPSYPVLKLLRYAKHLKGLIDDPSMDYSDKLARFPNLEMLTINFESMANLKVNVNVKQIYSHKSRMSPFTWLPVIFPNLERLHASISDDAAAQYVGSQLKNLKIIELDLRPKEMSGLVFGFQFLDSCPALESAYIYAETLSIIIDDFTKNKNLSDLVLSFQSEIDWHQLRKLLSKYPNIKHLAIRYNKTLEDQHVIHIISTLPKLVLLDVRGSYKVTRKAADFVQHYSERYGRSIKFYFRRGDKKIAIDWPQFSTRLERVSCGLNFMKHCFLKEFLYLPRFLDPMDD